jgi:hypothetical protein
MTKATIVGILTRVLYFVAGSWIGMLSLGAAHASDSRVPAVGFGVCCWLAVAFYGIAVLTNEEIES